MSTGPASPRPLPALVLAAGEGRRFRAAGGHGPKVLASLRGRPLLAHVLDAAACADLDPVVVVVGPGLAHDARLDAVLAGRPNVERLVHDDAAAGLGSSLAAGLAHLTGRRPPTDRGDGGGDDGGDDGRAAPDACVVLVGDQPGIAPAAIRDVVAAWRRTRLPARARYADGPGHPVVLPAGLWPVLPTTGDVGARGILAGREVSEVVITGPSPRDIDTPDDLDEASAP